MSIRITQTTVAGLETTTDADDLAGVILEATCTVTIEGVVDLDALRFEGEPLDPSAWDDPDLEDACNSWATAHRVFVNGTQLFGATTLEGELVFVSGGGIRPQETWGEVIAVYWDSSTYSAVGMSGFGADGVYLPRPGLAADVHYTDEELEIELYRVSATASPVDLAERWVQGPNADDRTLELLGLQPAEYVMPGDSLSTSLGEADLAELIRRVSG